MRIAILYIAGCSGTRYMTYFPKRFVRLVFLNSQGESNIHLRQPGGSVKSFVTVLFGLGCT